MGSPDKPRRWRRRLVRFTLAGLAATVLSVFALLAYVQTADFRHRIAGLIAHELEKATGEKAEVDDVVVSFLPPGLEIRGARLIHAPTNEKIASVASLDAPLLFSPGGVSLGELVIDRPQVRLHLEPDGKLREFRNAPKGSGNGLKQLPFTGLRVTGGDLTLQLTDGLVHLGELDITPTGGREHDLTGHLEVRTGKLEDAADLVVEHIVLGPTRIEVPDLLLEARTLTARARGSYDLDGTVDAHIDADSNLSALAPILPDGVAVRGKVRIEVDVLGVTPDIHGTAKVDSRALSWDLPGHDGRSWTYTLGDLDGALDWSPAEGIALAPIVVHGDRGRFLLVGKVNTKGGFEDLVVRAEGISLAHWLEAFALANDSYVDFTGDLTAKVTGTLKPLKIDGPFELKTTDLRVGDRGLDDPEVVTLLQMPAVSGAGVLAIDSKHLKITARKLFTPTSRGTVVADIGFAPEGPIDIGFQVSQLDLSELAPLGGAGLRGQAVVSSGRLYGPPDALQVRAEGDVTGLDVVGFRWADTLHTTVTSDMRGLRFEDATLGLLQSTPRGPVLTTEATGYYALEFGRRVTMDTDLVIHRGRVEDIVGIVLPLEGLTGEARGTVRLSGPFDALDGSADLQLGDVDTWGEHFEDGRVRVLADSGTYTLDDLRLSRHRGTEGVLARGTVAPDGALDVELLADGLGLQRSDLLAPLGLDKLTGTLAFAGGTRGTLTDPAPFGRLSLRELAWGPDRVDDSYVTLDTSDGVLHFDGSLLGGRGELTGTLGLWGERPYQVVAGLRALPVTQFVVGATAMDGRPLDGVVSGTTHLDGYLSGPGERLNAVIDLDDVRITWGAPKDKKRRELAADGPWHVQATSSSFSATGVALEGVASRLALDEAGYSPETGLVLSGGGHLDAAWLLAMVPGLHSADGAIGIEVGLEEQGLTAHVVAEKAPLLRHDGFPAALEDIDVDIVARSTGYRIDRLRASVGGGDVWTTVGRIEARNWIPTRIDIEAEALDCQVQYTDSLPPAVVNAYLGFGGPVSSLLLDGDVEVTEMSFSDRIDWEDWVVELRDSLLVEPTPADAGPALFGFDVRIRSQETISLQNNVASGTASASLRLIGDTARSGLAGRIDASGVAYLQDREFEMKRAQIAFQDPWSWDPYIDFDLETELSSERARYRVNYLVFGPFSNWQTETRSDPPLPQADINALLWYGATTEDLASMGELGSALALSGFDLVGTDLGLRFDRVRELQRLVVDRVDFVTGADVRGEYNSNPRLLFAKRVGSRSKVTLEWDYLASDSFLSWDWEATDNLSLSAWYSTRQRDRLTPVGAFGADVKYVWEVE